MSELNTHQKSIYTAILAKIRRFGDLDNYDFLLDEESVLNSVLIENISDMSAIDVIEAIFDNNSITYTDSLVDKII